MAPEDPRSTSGSRFRRLALGLVLMGAAFGYGLAVGRYEVFPFAQIRAMRDGLTEDEPAPAAPAPSDGLYGRWHPARQAAAAGGLDDETLSQLSQLGYVGGYEKAGESSGVMRIDPGRMQPGLTLVCSGHAPVVRLLAPNGAIVHEWRVHFEDIWPEPLPFYTEEDHKQFIRRAWALPNGDLLALFEYTGLVKLDRDSKVVWKRLDRNHHDFAVAPDGTIVSLARTEIPAAEVRARYPGFRSTKDGIYDDELLLLDADGRELKRISLFEAFHRSQYASLLSDRRRQRDVLHTNSVAFVRSWRPDDAGEREILVSIREIDAVATVSIEQGEVTWVLQGPWRRQHQASLLDNGHILLLDNQGGDADTPFVVDASEIVEIDPVYQRVTWRYRGTETDPFFTIWLGYVERLENGNTLITESAAGRLLEVTPEGEIVWEYLNPERTGPHDELIATLMGGRRIPAASLPFLSSLRAVETP